MHFFTTSAALFAVSGAGHHTGTRQHFLLPYKRCSVLLLLPAVITKWTYSLALVPDDDPIEHVSATVDMFTLAGRTFFNDLCQTAADNWN